jgi:NADH-quinone oxidoreductase subunit G
MAKITIDGRNLEVTDGLTIFIAAEKAGLSIPHFCYHPGLAPEGTCRMCVVDIEGAAKPEPSCSTVVRDGMKIETWSPRVVEARRNVLEFLLADHPIDCPICDKAGECRLQDYYRDYGLYLSEFHEQKARRSKILKIGERLILDRERCILCTRCVRFLRDVTKTGELGVFERGDHSEIGVAEGVPVATAYSGNLVDLCPVGAITDTTFRFRTRTWFLNPKPSICPFCARGCRVDVDVHPGFARHPETGGILRVRPRPDATPAGPWICDAGRYAWIEIESRRARRIVWNKGAAEAVLSGDKAFSILGAKIRALSKSGRTSRLTLVLHSGLTNEEWAAVKSFCDGFNPRPKIRLADPPDDGGDDFLRTAERTPNRRGAAEAGCNLRPLDPEELRADTDILFVFAGIWGDIGVLEHHPDVWGAIRTKALVSPVLTASDPLFDFVFPCAIPYEKSGSYIGFDGRRREFAAVRPALEEAESEGEILRSLLAACGLGARTPGGS